LFINDLIYFFVVSLEKEFYDFKPRCSVWLLQTVVWIALVVLGRLASFSIIFTQTKSYERVVKNIDNEFVGEAHRAYDMTYSPPPHTLTHTCSRK